MVILLLSIFLLQVFPGLCSQNYKQTIPKRINVKEIFERELSWQEGSNSLSYSPGIGRDSLYIPAFFPSKTAYGIICIDRRNGSIRWSTKLDSKTRTPILQGPILYVTTEKFLYALRDKNGSTLWKVNLGNEANPSTPILLKEAVILTTKTHLLAFDASKGKELWRYGFDNLSPEPAYLLPVTPMVIGRRLIVIRNDMAYGFDATVAVNRPIWKYLLRGIIMNNSVAADEANLYITSTKSVICLSIPKGKKRWEISPKFAIGGDAGALLLKCLDRLFLYGGGNYIYIINPQNGEVKAKSKKPLLLSGNSDLKCFKDMLIIQEILPHGKKRTSHRLVFLGHNVNDVVWQQPKVVDDVPGQIIVDGNFIYVTTFRSISSWEILQHK
jgi:outer membrane protein assembly factor BamB